jgi:hypothetical protein
MNLDYIISATKNPNWAHDFSRKESVDFINQTNKAEMNLAFEAEKENSLFVFTIGAIYIKAECCKCFPLYLAELIYKHVFQASQGHQLFLELLNLHFKSSKKNVARFIWGLCANPNNADIESFLKKKNSSPIILLYWLKMAIQTNKPITKHIFEIMKRIQEDSRIYEDIISFLIDNKTALLFDPIKGYFFNNDKKTVYQLMSIFEINWQFTFIEIDKIRNFLRSYPINASLLYGRSSNFSKNFLGTILNLNDYILREGSLVIPYNVSRIHEFVYYEGYDLERIFQSNQYVFDNLLVPQRYNILDVISFFQHLFLNKSFAFSRITTTIKKYGEKLSEDDIRTIPDIIEMDSSNRDTFKVWFALMCIDRTEIIPIIQDYIIVLKQMFIPRTWGHSIYVSLSSFENINEVVNNIRKYLPDFILNVELFILKWKIDENYYSKSLLPVIPVFQKEEYNFDFSCRCIRGFINFLNIPHPFNNNDRKVLLFPCKLQLLVLSKTKNELFSNLKDVLEHIGEESKKMGSNDVFFMEMMEEMFFIMENIFKRLKISMDDFYNIYELLPKHPDNNISEAFINDPRFSYLLTNFLEERKVKQLEQKCKEHLAVKPQSSITDAQSELGIVIVNCIICMGNYTPEFTDLLVPCGHTFCNSCSKKLVNCPNCRVKIESRLPLKKFNIRIRKDSDEHTLKKQKI